MKIRRDLTGKKRRTLSLRCEVGEKIWKCDDLIKVEERRSWIWKLLKGRNCNCSLFLGV